MDDKLLLRDATIQGIHFELLCRAKYNGLDGEVVLQFLMDHRELWESVLLDRVGIRPISDRCLLPASSLIKLRDLSTNFWNADTVYIMTATRENARALGRLIKHQEWYGAVRVVEE